MLNRRKMTWTLALVALSGELKSTLPGRNRTVLWIQDAVRTAIFAVEARLNSPISYLQLPPESEVLKEEFRDQLLGNLFGYFGGGVSISTQGCPGVPTIAADMTCL